MVRAAVVWMIVANFVFAIAFHVAVLVTMLAASVVFWFLGLRRRRIHLRDRPRRRRRSRRRAAGCRAKKYQADGHEPGGKPRSDHAVVLFSHKNPPWISS